MERSGRCGVGRQKTPLVERITILFSCPASITLHSKQPTCGGQRRGGHRIEPFCYGCKLNASQHRWRYILDEKRIKNPGIGPARSQSRQLQSDSDWLMQIVPIVPMTLGIHQISPFCRKAGPYLIMKMKMRCSQVTHLRSLERWSRVELVLNARIQTQLFRNQVRDEAWQGVTDGCPCPQEHRGNRTWRPSVRSTRRGRFLSDVRRASGARATTDWFASASLLDPYECNMRSGQASTKMRNDLS
jgi:hypothetical protein